MPEQIINAEIVKIESTQATGMAAIAKGLTEKANAIVVKTADEAGAAVDLAKSIKTTRTNMDEMRDKLVRPLNEHVGSINSWFMPSIKALQAAEKTVKDRIIAFNEEQARLQRIEAARLQKEAADKALADAAAAETKGDSFSAEVAMEVAQELEQAPAPEVKTAPIYGGTAMGKTSMPWTFEEVDHSIVPPELTVIDGVKVRALIAAGTREIKGLRIFQKARLAI